MKRNHMRLSAGFTLIELLVVVAIIGILAGLVLTALGVSRARAEDSRIISDINQYRRLGELHYNANVTTYTNFGTCVATPNSTNCKGGIENDVATVNNDLVAVGSAITANSNATTFCVSAPLKSNTNHACKDSTGKYSETPTGCGAGTVCP